MRACFKECWVLEWGYLLGTLGTLGTGVGVAAETSGWLLEPRPGPGTGDWYRWLATGTGGWLLEPRPGCNGRGAWQPALGSALRGLCLGLLSCVARPVGQLRVPGVQLSFQLALITRSPTLSWRCWAPPCQRGGSACTFRGASCLPIPAPLPPFCPRSWIL